MSRGPSKCMQLAKGSRAIIVAVARMQRGLLCHITFLRDQDGS